MANTQMRVQILCLFIILAAAEDTIFVFNQFNATSRMKYVADASIQSSAIRLTDHSERAIGRAYYENPVQMKRNGSVVSFSTSFVFAIVPQPRSGGGDGLCLVMTPTTALYDAFATQYLGLFNASTHGKESNHIFAVEFDTSQSIGVDDRNGNHVGVDLNSVNSVRAEDAGYWEGERLKPINLKSGRNIRAWIDYDGDSKQLEISIAGVGKEKPQKALVSTTLSNLDKIIEDEMYVGFSASTGSSPLVENHYILAWSFATGSDKAIDLDTFHLHSFYVKRSTFHNSTKFISIIIICSVAFILCLIFGTFYWLKSMGYIELYEEWELQYWPHRYDYKELKLATKGFSDENLLGYGGFGRVYRGTLPAGEEIAVKRITKDFTEGMQEFMAEICSLGRLQHRNLVPLRGWSRKNKHLFIVYDYMSNGSLETNLFNPQFNLTWPHRYKILTDVAAGLLYLHEKWEKCVVHRDIKSSNILLDCDLNGRVGDFGLARLFDHSENPQTTHVVGSLGYIAPELIHSGKPSPSTDVFSFGALLLEVACGRKPVDGQGLILVEWVWDLYVNGRLLEAVDEKLGGNYEKGEAENALILGILCSNPNPEERPKMKKVLQILCGEGALPADLNSPVATSLCVTE